jgi:hypothetical protein
MFRVANITPKLLQGGPAGTLGVVLAQFWHMVGNPTKKLANRLAFVWRDVVVNDVARCVPGRV